MALSKSPGLDYGGGLSPNARRNMAYEMIDPLSNFPPQVRKMRTARPCPFVAPEGVPIRVKLEIDPKEAYITLDFTGNIDCIPFGLNMSQSTVMACAVAGVLNNLDPTLPHNWGSFSRIIIKMRDGSVIGQAKHPISASIATTNLADRVINVVQACFGKVRKDLWPGGRRIYARRCQQRLRIDWRKNNAIYVRQLMMGGGRRTGPLRIRRVVRLRHSGYGRGSPHGQHRGR